MMKMIEYLFTHNRVKHMYEVWQNLSRTGCLHRDVRAGWSRLTYGYGVGAVHQAVVKQGCQTLQHADYIIRRKSLDARPVDTQVHGNPLDAWKYEYLQGHSLKEHIYWSKPSVSIWPHIISSPCVVCHTVSSAPIIISLYHHMTFLANRKQDDMVETWTVTLCARMRIIIRLIFPDQITDIKL